MRHLRTGLRLMSDTVVKLFWGAWDMWTGAWVPNPYIAKSREEQHRENVAAGYSCEHAYMPTQCPVCRSRQPRTGK